PRRRAGSGLPRRARWPAPSFPARVRRSLELLLNLLRETLEERRQLLRFGMIGRRGGHGDARLLAAEIGQSNGPEVGVLDRPALALHGGDRDAQRLPVALPRHDQRADVALRDGALLDGR